MASDKFKVKGLTDVKLRSDGQEIALVFETAQRTKLTIIVPGWEMRNLIHQMMQFDRQAQIKRDIPPEANDFSPPTFIAPPYMFIAAPSGLQCVVRPESGQLDLQIQDILDHEIQVSLTDFHARALFDALLQTQNLDDDQKPS